CAKHVFCGVIRQPFPVPRHFVVIIVDSWKWEGNPTASCCRGPIRHRTSLLEPKFLARLKYRVQKILVLFFRTEQLESGILRSRRCNHGVTKSVHGAPANLQVRHMEELDPLKSLSGGLLQDFLGIRSINFIAEESLGCFANNSTVCQAIVTVHRDVVAAQLCLVLDPVDRWRLSDERVDPIRQTKQNNVTYDI